MITVLVCGGRDYDDHQAVKRALDTLHKVYQIALVITGCADGADRWVRNWVIGNEVDVHVFAAKWKADGKKAGPLRNARMLAGIRPDIAVAFPGGRGTADMSRRCLAAGVRVVAVREDGASETLIEEVE